MITRRPRLVATGRPPENIGTIREHSVGKIVHLSKSTSQINSEDELKNVLAELENLNADLKSYQEEFHVKRLKQNNRARQNCLSESRPIKQNFILPLPPNPVPPLRSGSSSSLYDNCCFPSAFIVERRDQGIQTDDEDSKSLPESDSTGDYVRDFDALALESQQLFSKIASDEDEDDGEQISPVMKKFKLAPATISSPVSSENRCSTSTSMSNLMKQPAVVFVSPCYFSPSSKKSVSFALDDDDETKKKPPETIVVAKPLNNLNNNNNNKVIIIANETNNDNDNQTPTCRQMVAAIGNRRNASEIVRAYEEGRPLSYTITEWEEPKYQDYHKTDRYGFIHDMRLPDNYTEEEARVVKKQAERERKWRKMLSRWDKVPRDKLTNRVYKGIPDSFRSGAWSKLIGVETMRNRHPGKFAEFLNYGLANSRHIRQMDIDINRTFRDHVMFRERYSVKQRQLFHVLVAFSVYNAEVGYCQGMSTLAAFLLMYFENEEDCFWALAVLFTGCEVDDRHILSRYRMHGFYIDGFPKFQRFREHHAVLLKRYLPRLSKHFEKVGFKPELYLLKWLLDVFIGAIPISLLLRVWDIFLLEGERILSAFAFLVVKMHEKRLVKLRQLEDLLGYFQGLGNAFGTSDDVVIQCLQTTIDDLIRDKMLLPFVPSSLPNKIGAPPSELPRHRLGVIPPEVDQQQQASSSSPKPRQLFDDSNVSASAKNTPIIVMEDVLVLSQQMPQKQVVEQAPQEQPPQVPPPFVQGEHEEQAKTPPMVTKNLQLKENIVVTFVDEPMEKYRQVVETSVTSTVLGSKTDNATSSPSYSTPVKTATLSSTSSQTTSASSTPARSSKQEQSPSSKEDSPPGRAQVVEEQQVVWRRQQESSPTPAAPPPSASPAISGTGETSYSYTSYSPTYSPSPSKVPGVTQPAYQHMFQPLKSVSETLSELGNQPMPLGSSPTPGETTPFSLALAQAKMERDLREAEARRVRHQQARAEFFRAMLASGSLYSRGSTDYDDQQVNVTTVTSGGSSSNQSTPSRYMSQSAYQQQAPGTNGHMSEAVQQLEAAGGQSSSFTLIPVVDEVLEQPQQVHSAQHRRGSHGSRRSSSSSKHGTGKSSNATTPRTEQQPLVQIQQEVTTTYYSLEKTSPENVAMGQPAVHIVQQEAEYDNIVAITNEIQLEDVAHGAQGDYIYEVPVAVPEMTRSYSGGGVAQGEAMGEIDEMLHNSYYEQEPRVILPLSASFDSQRRASSKGSPVKEQSATVVDVDPSTPPARNMSASASMSSSKSSHRSNASMHKSTSVHSDV